ncbi:acetyl-CoA synthetase-like protein [Calocera cornea HHB12733]|uniref:Acetyl-CoA synthetase-like protein n=1 Tax=Calocera cornea HHB12733 TaxID=1353952 RepID=A0A165J0K4_9BASI|nr:acetyl-CoA synthetase-like protein [Calocera cornea HHB12733]
MVAGDFVESTSTAETAWPSFTLPPLDNSLLFPQWLDHHLEKNADHPYCVLVGSGNDDDVTVTWGEVIRASFRLAAKLREEIKVSEEQRKEGIRIAILTNADAITYCTLIFAILRAGFVAFPLSTRNSVPALVHLIGKTATLYVVGSVPSPGAPASALQETTASVLSALDTVQLLGAPTYTGLYPRLGSQPAAPYNAEEDAANTPVLPSVQSLPEYTSVTKDSPIMFLHSSGSTNFPKPIPMGHNFWISVCRTMVRGKFEATGTRWGLMGLPAFHGMGVCLMVGSAAAYGTISLMFKPSNLMGFPSPEMVLNACKRGKADYLFSVPSFYVDWSQDPEAVKYLATMKGVMYGGGPLAKETGDQLVKAGVNMVVAYGTTEIGLLFTLGVHRCRTMDWNYGELYPTMRVNLVPEGNNLYRLIVLDCDEHPIAVSNLPDIRAYDTNDLLERHPTERNLWKIVGRADDQIMMSNGEKTNPGPMENIISGNPNVNACLMFGRAKTQVGIVIAPAEHIKVENEDQLASFRNLIWPDIEKANSFAPQHSRIFKEFILVIDAKKKPFARTPKGTISRNVTLQQYEEEIEALYAAAEQPTRAEWAEPPTAWDEEALHSFIVRVVNGVMRGEGAPGVPLDEARDLFEQGCDSLQATYIRAAITSALRQAPKPEGKSDIAATSVPQNLVFSYSTVKRLVTYMTKVVAAVAGQYVYEEDETAKMVEDMTAMVEKYSQNFPVHTASDRRSTGAVVLLTGSTGSLGTYLLEQLLLDERVECVYAVNRLSEKHDLLARQRDAFVDRGVDVQLLQSPKLRLIETDANGEDLGLSEELREEICAALTTIIHTAWRVDFNLSLSSFEPHVRSTRALIDLSLQSQGPAPAQLIFTSSIGTLLKWAHARPVPEEAIADPLPASTSGYSASKWVAERVMLAAGAERGLRATVWRVGQLAGSKRNGAWNGSDWLPLMVRSARGGGLPRLGGDVSWVRVDEAAQAIVQAMSHPAAVQDGEATYLHLVHPRPVAWDTLLAPLAKAVGCALVPYREWLERVEEAARDPTPVQVQENPATKLLAFFRSVGAAEERRVPSFGPGEGEGAGADRPREAMGLPDLAVRRSAGLGGMRELGEGDVRAWVGYWRAKGLLVARCSSLA